MYQYIYDAFLSEEKYLRPMTIIENRLADLGLQGRVNRLNLFKDPRELILEGIKRGVDTVVAVGNDETLSRVVNAVGDFNLTVGMIPIGPKNEITRILGVEEGLLACDCLSSRLIRKIDLGKINDIYFLAHLKAGSEVSLRYGKDYQVRSLTNNLVEIYNLPTREEQADPEDGYLEARIRPSERKIFKKNSKGDFSLDGKSYFPVRKVILEGNEGSKILVDGLKLVSTPAEVQILPRQLKVIVGKNRFFK
ncbi:MAG: diacylglycerol kinase family protein [Patescibacteria group bacterium]